MKTSIARAAVVRALPLAALLLRRANDAEQDRENTDFYPPTNAVGAGAILRDLLRIDRRITARDIRPFL